MAIRPTGSVGFRTILAVVLGVTAVTCGTEPSGGVVSTSGEVTNAAPSVGGTSIDTTSFTSSTSPSMPISTGVHSSAATTAMFTSSGGIAGDTNATVTNASTNSVTPPSDTGVSDASAQSATTSTTDDSSDSSEAVTIDVSPRPVVEASAGTELVKVDVETKYQTFEGWGTSLCWWANHVGGWSESARNAVVKAVVDPVDGMGYTIFRYNIGGGENPAHAHMQQYRDMPGFMNAQGEWTWQADANQRAILLAIDQLGAGLIFEAFSNSPPYWMTKSECASGHTSGADNLKEDAYDAFADYLTEVVKHYRDEYGIQFRTLEPLNEPDSDWWKANGTQEGCHFSPSSQERILAAVAQQLSDKGLTATRLSASDENSMDEALRNIGAFSQKTLDVIDQLNVHSYAGTRRTELRELATAKGKRLWQSESGPLGQSISDDTDAALFMAGRIISDLRDLKPEAWLDWQSGDPGRSWASFTLNDQRQTHSPIKRFYMHAGFSRYIRPGATFVAVNDADMVAAQSRDGQYVTVVVRNPQQDTERSFTFDLTSFPNVGAAVSVHRVSRTEDLVSLEDLQVQGYSFVATVPAYSVTTFVIPLW